LYWKRQAGYAAALAEYQAAAQLEPKNPEWQIALGDAYASTGDLVAALAAYEAATTLAPDNAAYWRLLALFSADHGIQVLEVGLPAAKKAAEGAPNDPQALDTLGWTYSQAGLLYNAEQTLLKATNLAPESALTHLHLAETYLRKGDQATAHRELDLAHQLDAVGPIGQLAAQLIGQYFP
jgi:Flp pilus assembly protein TadD